MVEKCQFALGDSVFTQYSGNSDAKPCGLGPDARRKVLVSGFRFVSLGKDAKILNVNAYFVICFEKFYSSKILMLYYYLYNFFI